jgi:hypothetical protein
VAPRELVRTPKLGSIEEADCMCTGRTTFVNTLCGKKVLQGKDSDDPTNAHLEEGVRIKPVTVGE